MVVMFRALFLVAICLLPQFIFAADPLLEQRMQRIEAHSADYGNGGLSVLKSAYEALSQGQYELVSLEDLWATALKEGKTLFSGKKLWSATLPAQTGDMLGQTTIGPWQITIANAREFGAAHGVVKTWSDGQVLSFLELKPVIQAQIGADFMEASYRKYGRRAPSAIQSYFWLDAFVQKKIGQGPWYASVLAKAPGQMAQTGFYAKQLLLGSRFNPEGLLYWLYRAGDETAVRETLALWNQKGYPITTEDLEHCSCDPAFRDWLSDEIRN
jgi:hypothetical protein